MSQVASPEISWLVRQPIAHRGFHSAEAGRRENTISAARAAIERGFAIECDVQLSADGEAMVFHDERLERLTGRAELVGELSAAELSRLAVGRTLDGIPTLRSFIDIIAGQVPLICEIKSAFVGDTRLTDRVAQLASSYAGPLAIKSFDPAILSHLRKVHELSLPLGIVAEAHYDDPEWAFLKADQKRDLAALTHFAETRPDFLSFAVNDLPHAGPSLFRMGLRCPVVTWTVRTPDQRDRAGIWADQIVFEGFVP